MKCLILRGMLSVFFLINLLPCITRAQSKIIINEIHADPAGDISGDANGDGVRSSSDDEFIELVNGTSSAEDISGWTISDAVRVRHVFPAGTIIPAGKALVIFGGGTPSGDFGSAQIQTASSGGLSLNNSGDDVIIKDSSGAVETSYTYGSEGGKDQSLARMPDITGEFILHSQINGSGGSNFSPGKSNAEDKAFPLLSGVTIMLRDSLITDYNGNSKANPGDEIKYSAVIRDTCDYPAIGLLFRVPVDTNTSLKAATVISSAGTIIKDGEGADTVIIVLGGMEKGSGAEIEFTVMINNPFPEGADTISFQAYIEGENVLKTYSADPDYPANNGKTYTGIYRSVRPSVKGIETGMLDYIEDSPPLTITNTVIIDDEDSDTLTGGTVMIDSNYAAGEDELVFEGYLNIAGVFDAAAGKLSLTGESTKENYKTALRSIKYFNSNTVHPDDGVRRISFRLNDGEGGGGKASRYINIIQKNDPPVLNGIESTAAEYCLGAEPVKLTETLSLRDDDSGNMHEAEIIISSNYSPGEDILIFNNTERISGSFDAGSGALKITGTDTKLNYLNAIKSIKYFNLQGEDITTAAREVSIRISDGSGYSGYVTRKIIVLGYTLTSPAEGEKWRAGSEKQIKWRGSEGRLVRIELTTDGGKSWITLGDDINSSLGYYNLTVPNEVSEECAVMLTDMENNALSSATKGRFTICRLNLKEPAEEAEIIAGENERIAWESGLIEKLDIKFSDDDGKTWIDIVDNLDAAVGHYLWAVPNYFTSRGKIRLAESGGSGVYCESGGNIKINLLRLISPDGGEYWRRGTVQNIEWECGGTESIKLEYSINGGKVWKLIDTLKSEEKNTYTWTPPDTVSKDCMVKVSSCTDSALYDISNSSFTLYELKLLSPSGGEYYNAGSRQEIRWESGAIDSVALEYSSSGGKEWNIIYDSAAASPGKYEWTIPDHPSPDYLIRISDASENNISDTSGREFTVYKLKMVKPGSGDTLIHGTNCRIEWECEDIHSVAISFSEVGGNKKRLIATAHSNGNGVFEWPVPDITGQKIDLLIYNPDDPKMKDEAAGLSVLLSLPGDADQNGILEKHDAVVVMSYIIGLITLTEEEIRSADINGDGKIDAYDAAVILSLLAEK